MLSPHLPLVLLNENYKILSYHSLLRKLHSRNIFFVFYFTCVITMRYMCLMGSYQCRLFCLGIL